MREWQVEVLYKIMSLLLDMCWHGTVLIHQSIESCCQGNECEHIADTGWELGMRAIQKELLE